MSDKKLAHFYALLNIFSLVFSFFCLIVFMRYSDFGNEFFSIFNQVVMFLLPFICLCITQKRKPSYYLHLKSLSFANWFLVLSISIVTVPVLSVFNLISLQFTKNVILENLSDMFMTGTPLLTFFAVACVPAILEEINYRGVILTLYRKTNMRTAIVMNGLLFALIHHNLNQISYTFVLGMLLCYMVIASGSIFSSMIMHFIINGTSALNLIFNSDDLQAYKEIPPFWSVFEEIFVIFGISLTLLIILLIIFHQYNKDQGNFIRFEEPELREKIVDWPLVAYFLCILAMIFFFQ